MSSIVIKNTRVMQTMPPFAVTENVDVVIQDDIIKAVGKGAGDGVKADKIIDGRNKTVTPGNICGHHHYYSGLSRGMLISAGAQTDLIQILKEWWWRLDRGLNEEATYYSSLICSLDAIAAGTTTCIDHHASPNYIANSLDTIANGMEEVGLRGTTCYEVTDRNFGMKEVEAGVEENLRFAKSAKSRKLVRGMVGGHAPFTIPDEGLRMIGEVMQETGSGLHLHVAEGQYDVVHSHHHYNMDIVDRLEKFGLLTHNSLLVHGLYLNEGEIDKINSHDTYFAHNPRSNMNNQVGYCKHLQKVKNLIVGTDGCGGNMFEELKIAFFKHRDHGGTWWPNDFVTAMARGNELVAKYFDGKFGRVEEGYKADLSILDYHSPTPLVADNSAGHVIWGMSSNAVESVIIDGKLVMENRQFPGIDVSAIYDKAAEVAKRIWEKVDTIAP